jgi:glycosyltransferase involved in cell wall biosynthesis
MNIEIKPKVSVICVTYKHEMFIRDAIDSFIMQKTDFPIEILIGDDASPDNTAEIVSEYADRFPEKIIPVLHKKNLGALENLNSLISIAKGEYFTLCDGDDYWIDSKKLQKQADFLDQNPDFSLCFHPVKQVFVDNSQPTCIIDPFSFFDYSVAERNYFTIRELLAINFIASLSVMYRWQIGKGLPKWMLQHKIGDLPIHLLHASTGKIGIINEVMGVYRKHDQGFWWDHNSLEHKKTYLEDYYHLMSDVNTHLEFKFNDFFQPILSGILTELIKMRKEETNKNVNFFNKPW